MKKRILLICALLVSVITLSGAANRSFPTEMEQWNPIGITQASNGMTQSQAGSPITNRLTAGSAILPTVATAAPSGVLRGGSTNVITFTTEKEIGESVKLQMTYTGDAPTLGGLTGTPKSGEFLTYTLTSQTVTITGDVIDFDCSDNLLTALDVSQNTALIKLHCDGNQLTTLDVSQNIALTELYCYYNKLTALDVSKNTALTWLHCNNNPLTALDVSKNTRLTWLYCNNNQLTALDVSKNTWLARLNCSNNPLTALDISKNTDLTWLYCYNNQLTALDVSKNTFLNHLICPDNQIKGEEMTRLVNSLPDRTGNSPGEFTVVREPGLEGNICLKSDVAIAKGKNWITQKVNYDTKEHVAYEGENVITFTTAKEVGETVELLMFYTGAAPTLSGATGTPKSGRRIAYKLTSQTVTITGDVTFLDCIGNQLTTLDVSKNTALEKLFCSKNQLTTLDVSKKTVLKSLGCSENQLTALDVSKNTALKFLYCNNNQLTALDVSKNTALTELYCYNNQLKALDVSRNTALTGLDCSGNQIKGEEMTRLVNSLPDRTGKEAGEIVVVQSGAESNRCLKSDVAIAKSKNWNTKKYNSDTDESVAYGGEEPIPYAVTLTKEGEGTLTATGADNLDAVPEGTKLTIVATPAAGYELTALTANSTDILATKKFTVTADTKVKATFSKMTAVDVVEAGSVCLYPNPASTYVNVKATKADALVRLYDANGTLRYEARTAADGTLQIDLSAYAEGTYLLRVGDDAQRLLIQR